MRLVQSVLLILISIVVITFAISNSEPVNFYYYFDSVTMPFSLALGLALVIGCFLGILSCLKVILRGKYEVRALKKEISIANREISNLRAIPIKDEH